MTPLMLFVIMQMHQHVLLECSQGGWQMENKLISQDALYSDSMPCAEILQSMNTHHNEGQDEMLMVHRAKCDIYCRVFFLWKSHCNGRFWWLRELQESITWVFFIKRNTKPVSCLKMWLTSWRPLCCWHKLKKNLWLEYCKIGTRYKIKWRTKLITDMPKALFLPLPFFSLFLDCALSKTLGIH